MPVISMFYGIIVSMYFFDAVTHHRPHIHVRYQDQEAVVSIPEGELLEGPMNPRVVQAAAHDNYTLTLTFCQWGDQGL